MKIAFVFLLLWPMQAVASIDFVVHTKSEEELAVYLEYFEKNLKKDCSFEVERDLFPRACLEMVSYQPGIQNSILSREQIDGFCKKWVERQLDLGDLKAAIQMIPSSFSCLSTAEKRLGDLRYLYSEHAPEKLVQ